MSESTKSLLTLLALIFGSIAVFVAVFLWWCDRYIDKMFDHDDKIDF